MNRFPIAKAIKAEMGDDTVVVHKCGMPFTVQSSIDGKKGKLECLPLYYHNCLAPCGVNCCPGAIKATALNAKAIATTGGPEVAQMSR